MNSHSLPSIVGCDTSSNKNKGVYDAWAENYEKDIRSWGYALPEIVAGVLWERSHEVVCPQSSGAQIRILDAGAGDGLSGVALRIFGWDKSSTFISGNDISPAMLDIAKQRKCYDEVKVVDLNKSPLPYATDEFDLVTCIGTMTYVDPKSGLLEDFVRRYHAA